MQMEVFDIFHTFEILYVRFSALVLEVHVPAEFSSYLDTNSAACNFLLILKT